MPHDVTRILGQWRDGDSGAADRLFPLVYDELRRRARRYLNGEAPGHTLQPTALVHEAYMRMVGGDQVDVVDRIHFYAIASRVMRQILVDHARRRNAGKRGGPAKAISLSEPATLNLSTDGGADLVSLDQALKDLEHLDERKSRVVDMRFFGGLTNAEIAVALDITEKTVQRDWQFARMFLYRALSNGS